jgi:hypothetical protein
MWALVFTLFFYQVPNVAIILTEEGPLNTFNGYNDSSRALKERGITLMSVGVGNRVNQYELQRIATSPERALLVNTLDDAIASIATVANATCLGKLTDEITCVNVFSENGILTYLP